MMIMAVTKAMMMMVVMRMMLMVVISRAFVISQLAAGTKGTKGGQMLKLHETLQFTLQSRETHLIVIRWILNAFPKLVINELRQR